MHVARGCNQLNILKNIMLNISALHYKLPNQNVLLNLQILGNLKIF